MQQFWRRLGRLSPIAINARTPTTIINIQPIHTSHRSYASVDMETVNTTERLSYLRKLMKQHGVDIYSIVRNPSTT